MNIKEYSQKIINNSEIFSDLVSACSTLLKHSPNAFYAREYLKTRISDNAIASFNFGYFPPNDKLSELFDFLSEDKLKQLDIIYDKKISHANIYHSIFNSHNLVLPYKNTYGDIIALVGRTLLSKEKQKELNISKYKNSSFQKRLHLFGLNKAKNHILKSDSVILVEGQFDCIACHMHGINNVVAVGSASLSKYQLFLILRYTKNIYIMFDNDDAGKNGTDKAINRFKNYAFIKKISLNNKYKDIDEYLKDGNNLII